MLYYAEELKAKFYLLLQVFIAFLMPVAPLIFLIIMFVFLDTLLGLYKCKKLKIKIESHKMFNFVSKTFLYLSSILFTFILEKYLLHEIMKLFISVEFFLTKIFATFFILVELVSINENIDKIWNINFFKVAKNMLTSVKEIKKDINEIG